jgi:hypothetical protein
MYTPNRYQTIAVRNECEFQDSVKNPGFRISRSHAELFTLFVISDHHNENKCRFQDSVKNPSFHLIRSLWNYLRHIRPSQ